MSDLVIQFKRLRITGVKHLPNRRIVDELLEKIEKRNPDAKIDEWREEEQEA